ncbi:MAG: hypothetical protein ACREJB_17615, partial [Planctomycetaceae bacterium]
MPQVCKLRCVTFLTLGLMVPATASAQVTPGVDPGLLDESVPSVIAAPAEESPLLVQPESPEDVLRAAMLLTRLARPNLAKQQLDRLLALDEQQLLALRDRFGPAVFLQLSNNMDLRPQSQQLLDKITDLTRRRGTDPQYIDSLLASVSGNPAQRESALIALHDAGPIVVPRLIQVLGDPQRVEQHD